MDIAVQVRLDLRDVGSWVTAALTAVGSAADERTDQRSASAKFSVQRPGNIGDPGCPRQVLPLDRPKRRRGGLSWSAAEGQHYGTVVQQHLRIEKSDEASWRSSCAAWRVAWPGLWA